MKTLKLLLSIIVVSLFVNGNLCGQTIQKRVDVHINGIDYGAETITIDELRDHIYYLASDELEGRFPGTSGYEKAIEYVVTQLRQAGLSPVLQK